MSCQVFLSLHNLQASVSVLRPLSWQSDLTQSSQRLAGLPLVCVHVHVIPTPNLGSSLSSSFWHDHSSVIFYWLLAQWWYYLFREFALLRCFWFYPFGWLLRSYVGTSSRMSAAGLHPPSLVSMSLHHRVILDKYKNLIKFYFCWIGDFFWSPDVV